MSTPSTTDSVPSPSPTSPALAGNPAAAPSQAGEKPTFTQYQKVIVAILAFLQFTIILDFMILSPLGALLLRDLHIPTTRFGLLVSVYAFSAGISGFLAAGFADRFDRKRMLLFFYAGFLGGTLLCGIANTYHFLLFARMTTGLFGGVISSISFAIIADLFPLSMRGRVMGVVQTSFSVSQVMGIPLGLYLSDRWSWHAPFLMILAVATIVGIFIAVYMRPINEHLKLQRSTSPFRHLLRTVSRRRYLRAFGTTIFLVTGGYMLMPFASAFTVNNIGIPFSHIRHIYMVAGIATLIAGPLVGRFSDAVGKYPLFCVGSALTIAMIVIYTHLGVTPINQVIIVNALLYIGVTSRIISASALMSAVPDPASRGSFMAVNSSLQQVAGGVASAVAGLIVVQTASGSLAHYDILGYVVIASIGVTVVMLYFIDRMVKSDVEKPPLSVRPSE